MVIGIISLKTTNIWLFYNPWYRIWQPFLVSSQLILDFLEPWLHVSLMDFINVIVVYSLRPGVYDKVWWQTLTLQYLMSFFGQRNNTIKKFKKKFSYFNKSDCKYSNINVSFSFSLFELGEICNAKLILCCILKCKSQICTI